MKGFPIDLDRLKGLAATRGGRVALAGFEYQRAFATLRMVSMLIGHVVKGSSTQIPAWIRYEWAEDIDELDTNGGVTLWQCKQGNDWTEPAKLAKVFSGFAPKWLWTADTQRERLNLRLVTNDVAYAEFRDLPGALKKKTEVYAHFLNAVRETAGKGSDLAQWQDEAQAFGLRKLFNEMWSATQVLFVPDEAAASTAALWPAEDDAVNALARAHWLAPDQNPQDVIHCLHALLGLAPSNTGLGGQIDRLTTTPLGIRPIDVNDRLDPFRREHVSSSLFLPLIDRTALQQLRKLPQKRYVARRPEWKDVVHGSDATIGFFERSITSDVVDGLRNALNDCLQSQEKLRLQLLVGAPGSGKSTLAIRAAAQLVDEGVCTAIDARFAVNDEEEVLAVVATLQGRQDPKRALLLVLDDPLGVASLWPRVLDKLSKLRPRMVVLAATPEFLLDRYSQQLSSLRLLPPRRVERPDCSERLTLARFYPKSDMTELSSGNEELLVLTMLAATNTPFDEIIDGLWDNLAEGARLPRTVLGRELPWQVAALWLVVFFNRAYGACPLLLLKAFLAPWFRDDEEVGERLAQMKSAHGWGVFQIEESPASFASQGGVVRTMHTLVAQAAWDRRPAASWSVTESIAKASLRFPMAARPLAQALVALHEFSAAEAKPLLTAVANAWCAADVVTLETRYLCELCWIWKRSAVPMPPCINGALLHRIALNDEQSWLAAYHVLYLGSTTQVRSLSHALPYRDVLDSADFFIEQSRAMALCSALVDQPTLQARLLDHIWCAFDDTKGARISSNFLNWMMIHGGAWSVVSRKDVIRAWIAQHPDDTHVRVAFMMHLKRLTPADCTATLNDLRRWLAEHPEDMDVRNSFLAHLGKFSEIDQAAILDDYVSWLAVHPNDSNVRNGFLKHIDKLSVAEQILVLDAYWEWLADHPEDTNVRAAFLSHVHKFSEEKQAFIFSEYSEWLTRHSDDTNVRSALLKCLHQHAHHTLPKVIEQTLAGLSYETRDFHPAGAVLLAVGGLGIEHLQLIVRWLQWLAQVLERYKGIKSAAFFMRGSLTNVLEQARGHAQSDECPEHDRVYALLAIEHLENSIRQWRESVGRPVTA
ncbi:ATP-binding protein [Pseudomonas carnis]|uniref:ATP-binding protein n=1 Tax=Pseudomonas TaxID=286 RepID=UPI0018E63856|nr:MULTISPECIES: ATP-binding protein [Pseudomonas]MBI6659236.1 ATP-binding protein [Pseudomonas carnis]MBI6664353.1 ATP-binding protein [Pseudomonas carnis]MBI6689855.1 ATP-binding protein [Pseudomonas carnis]MCF5684775.1 hypothetical protein [Pseudomonas sp. PA-1-3F]